MLYEWDMMGILLCEIHNRLADIAKAVRTGEETWNAPRMKWEFKEGGKVAFDFPDKR